MTPIFGVVFAYAYFFLNITDSSLFIRGYLFVMLVGVIAEVIRQAVSHFGKKKEP